MGNTQEAKKLLLEFVPFQETENVLNSVKPPRLIQRMLQLSTNPMKKQLCSIFFRGAPRRHTRWCFRMAPMRAIGDIFAFSSRRLCRAPEASLRTIADIGTARIRGVSKAANGGDQDRLDLDTLPDVGFRYHRLSTSNVKTWNSDRPTEGSNLLAEQLTLYVDHVLPDRSQEDILFEILLKAGYPLTADIRQVALAGQTAFSISAGNPIVCLESRIAAETLRAAAELEPKPVQVICLDHAFEGNDQLKTNIVLEIEASDIRFRTV